MAEKPTSLIDKSKVIEENEANWISEQLNVAILPGGSPEECRVARILLWDLSNEHS